MNPSSDRIQSDRGTEPPPTGPTAGGPSVGGGSIPRPSAGTRVNPASRYYRRAQWACLAVLAALAMIVVGVAASRLRRDTIALTVTNAGTSTLDDVTIAYGGHEIPIGSLAPGQTARREVRPERWGGFKIALKAAQGQPMSFSTGEWFDDSWSRRNPIDAEIREVAAKPKPTIRIRRPGTFASPSAGCGVGRAGRAIRIRRPGTFVSQEVSGDFDAVTRPGT